MRRSLLLDVLPDDFHRCAATATSVGLVCCKPDPEIDASRVTGIVGCDFGDANTAALSVALCDVPIGSDDGAPAHPPQGIEASLRLINDIKKVWRDLCRKITAIKTGNRSTRGLPRAPRFASSPASTECCDFFSNVAVIPPRKHNAAIVRDELKETTIEKSTPDYKGRTFKMMLQKGSKGQHQRRASDQFQWNDISEIDIPSGYTPQVHPDYLPVIDQELSKRECIYLPCGDRCHHSGGQATDTIASDLFVKHGTPWVAHAA